MKSVIFAAISLLSISCSGIVGQGDITTRQIEISNLASVQTVSITNSFTMTFSDDVPEGVLEISTYENIHSYVKTSYTSNSTDEKKLTIYLDATKVEGNLQLNARMKPTSSLNKFVGSDNSTFKFDTTASDTYGTLELSGSSKFYGYAYSCASLQVSLVSSCYAEITTIKSNTLTNTPKINGSITSNSTFKYKGVEIDDENNTMSGTLQYVTE